MNEDQMCRSAMIQGMIIQAAQSAILSEAGLIRLHWIQQAIAAVLFCGFLLVYHLWCHRNDAKSSRD